MTTSAQALTDEARRRLIEGDLAGAITRWERLLEGRADAEAFEAMLLPFQNRDVRAPRGPLYDLLARVERETAGASAPWGHLVRVSLLDHLGFRSEALEGSLTLTQVPTRYGFMRAKRAMLLLPLAGAYREARIEFEASFAAAPTYWKADAMAAECLLCLGDEGACIERMDRCVARLREQGNGVDVDMAVVWRGAVHLWTGRYADALADLDDPAERDVPLARCWRGAARLLTGELPKALADLEHTQRNGRDPEGAAWLAEAHERLGDLPRALALYDRAASDGALSPWVRLGRALVKHRLGDERGFWADVAMVPRRMIDLFEWRSGTSAAGDAARTAALLVAIRTAARGLRRPEEHMLPVFLRPG